MFTSFTQLMSLYRTHQAWTNPSLVASDVSRVCFLLSEIRLLLFLRSALRGCMHRLPAGVESVRCRIHVGGLCESRRGSSDSICHSGRICQILHPVQPPGLPGLQTQLPQVPSQTSTDVVLVPVPAENGAEKRGQGKLQWTSQKPPTLQVLPGPHFCSLLGHHASENSPDPDRLHEQRGSGQSDV